MEVDWLAQWKLEEKLFLVVLRWLIDLKIVVIGSDIVRSGCAHARPR